MGVGILFGLSGLFLQSLTEWVFRHSPIYYTAHILLGVLASLYWLKRREKRQQKAVAEAAYQENFAPVGTVPHLSGVSTG